MTTAAHGSDVGLARAVGVNVDRDVEMRARDGTILRSDVYRPADGESDRPVLLHRTPYDKRYCQQGVYLHPAWYARQGFTVVVQDVRGRHASEGAFVPFAHERQDGYDAVEWAAGLDGSSAAVGMYGASYPGAVQLLAAVEQPPHLAAIAPAVTSADFHAGWTYEGGALNLAFVVWWALILAEDLAHRRQDRDTLERVREIARDPNSRIAAIAPAALAPLLPEFYRDWLAHPENDDYWTRLGIVDLLDCIDVPALHIAGWYDIFLAGSVDAYQRLAARPGGPEQSLLIGPWFHYPWGSLVGDANFDPEAAGTGRLDRAQLRFFREHLAGADASGPSVEFFTLFESRWRRTAGWPPPEAVPATLYLHSEGAANTGGGDGRLDEEPPAAAQPCDVYEYYPAYSVPAAGGHSCCDAATTPMGCHDQAAVESLAEVLVYTSDPLPAPCTFAGPVDVELFVATDAVSADYVARLCLVGCCSSRNVAEGIRRLAASELESARGEDGVAAVEISLRSTAFSVEAGQRVRLHVTSGCFPTHDRNPQTGALPAEASIDEARGATHAVFHTPGRASCLRAWVLPDPPRGG